MNRSLQHGWVLSLARGVAAGTSIALLAASLAGAAPSSVLYSTEGNRLRRYDLDTVGDPPLVEDVLVERASAAETGSSVVGEFRDINGMICQLHTSAPSTNFCKIATDIGTATGIAIDPLGRQGALVVALHLGNDVTYCTRLGGTVLRDVSGMFVAKDAPAPATCPLP